MAVAVIREAMSTRIQAILFSSIFFQQGEPADISHDITVCCWSSPARLLESRNPEGLPVVPWSAGKACQGNWWVFKSNSTAAGLYVTISSTLEVLAYLTSKVGYKYLMTSRTSQDPLENFFRIVRQASGNNDHTTTTQFLITVNCLSLYGLVRSVSNENCEQGTLASLLEARSNHPLAERSAVKLLLPLQLKRPQKNTVPQHNAGLKWP